MKIAASLACTVALMVAGVAPASAHPGIPDVGPVSCTNPHVTYGNGAVISSVQIVQVNWGPNVAPATIANFESWYPAIVVSGAVSWLKEYDTTLAGGTMQKIGPGVYFKNPATSGSWTITPINTATTIDDTAIGPELFAQIAAGKLPPPTKDAQGFDRTLYMIDFPPGIIITLGGGASCTTFCGYHNDATNGGVTIAYGVLPDMGPGSGCEPTAGKWSCGGSTDPIIATSVVHGQTLGNAITDPHLPAGWTQNANGCGDIGLICANELGVCGDTSCQSPSVGTVILHGTTFYTQTQWSNVKNDCVVQYCASNADCTLFFPVCNVTSSSCGPCATTSDCPQGYKCEVTSGSCVILVSGDAGSPPQDAGAADGGNLPDAGGPLDAGPRSGNDGGGGASSGDGSSKGCGCALPGLASSSWSGGAAAMAAALLGLTGARRRRRKHE